MPTTAKSSRDQRILDPIHGLMFFACTQEETDDLAWRLLATQAMQRLRRIRQLGFGEFVYPGATHNRFVHSLGVFHTARRIFSALEQRSEPLEPEQKQIALLAALLHDLGHGPLSHSFEQARQQALAAQANPARAHEDWSQRFIREDEEIVAILGEEQAARVADFLAASEQHFPATAIQGPLDADRLDYLRRDRYMTGISSGDIDADWLITSLRLVEVAGQQQLALEDKALNTFERFMLVRDHLYRDVYTHKTITAADTMFARLLTRLTGGDEPLLCAHPLAALCRIDEPDLRLFRACDDGTLFEAWARLQESKNQEIAQLAWGLRHRRLHKVFECTCPAEDEDRVASIESWAKGVSERNPELLSSHHHITAGIKDSDPLYLLNSKDPKMPQPIAMQSAFAKRLPRHKIWRFYAANADQLEDKHIGRPKMCEAKMRET